MQFLSGVYFFNSFIFVLSNFQNIKNDQRFVYHIVKDAVSVALSTFYWNYYCFFAQIQQHHHAALMFTEAIRLRFEST